jgi:hypothetical protein
MRSRSLEACLLWLCIGVWSVQGGPFIGSSFFFFLPALFAAAFGVSSSGIGSSFLSESSLL